MSETTRPRVVRWPAGERPRAELLRDAAAVLLGGGVVAFPTDTVYGIGADQAQAPAVARLYEIKRRPPTRQIALLIYDPFQMRALAAHVTTAADLLAVRYWPGALTIVLAARGGGGTIAFRQPDHALTRGLIRAVGRPIATTSANLSDHPSARTAADVLAQLPLGYELLIDGGPTPGGTDSTVIDCTGPVPRVLRPGALDRAELEALVGADYGP